MAEAEEDFTFPATSATPPPSLLESPPLWQPVSRLKSSENLNYEEEEVGKFKLCSCQECNITLRKGCYFVDEQDKEENMDLLWEDLNEIFSRNSGKMEEETDNSSPQRNVQICCVKTLKLSKPNVHTINGLKASIVALIRFLMKKGLGTHSSGGSIKKLMNRV